MDNFREFTEVLLDEMEKRIEELESENENLHIENDTLCQRLQNEQPDKCTACKGA